MSFLEQIDITAREISVFINSLMIKQLLSSQISLELLLILTIVLPTYIFCRQERLSRKFQELEMIIPNLSTAYF